MHVYEESIEFLLALVARTGHNPEHHQAQGLLVRIEEMKRQRKLDDEPLVDRTPPPAPPKPQPAPPKPTLSPAETDQKH